MIKIRVFESLQQISSATWEQITPADFPFMSYHFLLALETTECLGTRTGWVPIYLTAWDNSELVGALLCFVKNNSYGEYIFDFAWAEVHEAIGESYYPKLVSAIPFTPATGPKILLHSRLDFLERESIATLLINELQRLGQKLETSSTHILFIPKTDLPSYEKAGFMIRHSYQFHWVNDGYSSISDFLKSLRAKRRKEISRERMQVAESPVEIKRLTGDALTPLHADIFYEFYFDTVSKMGGHDYLTPDFFRYIFRTMKDQVLLVLAQDLEGKPVAGALNYFGNETLFGRHWGCLENYKSLHFEVCYYQGIEFAIERGFHLFEAGAQGEHKFNRGFLPNLTYSAHQIHHPKIDGLVRDFVAREKIQIEQLFSDYSSHTPFSRASD